MAEAPRPSEMGDSAAGADKRRLSVLESESRRRSVISGRSSIVKSVADGELSSEAKEKKKSTRLTFDSNVADGEKKPAAFNLPNRRKSTLNVQQTIDAFKERMAKVKEARDQRRLKLGPAHAYILGLVADRTGMDAATIEDFILDTAKQINLFEGFMMKDGQRSLMFYHQEGEMLSNEETGRTAILKVKKLIKVFITDGTEEPLVGLCIYFLREQAENINANTVVNVLMGTIDVTKTGHLGAFGDTMRLVMNPLMKTMPNWGLLDKSPSGKQLVRGFIDNLSSFCKALDGAEASASYIKNVPGFSPALHIATIHTAQQCVTAAEDHDFVVSVENDVTLLSRKIEQVLSESEQMRRDADDSGPYDEVAFWRITTAKYNSILQVISGHDCSMAIQILNIAKSKVLKVWQHQNNHLTDAANEAKDNLRYLYTLEQFCEPLYRCEPLCMADKIASLINAIRMIHSISRYYNTSERMTSLFIKVTNQMVNACKGYLTEDGLYRVWEQDRAVVIKRIHDCLTLKNSYEDAFNRAQKQLEETPGEKPFGFSKKYIFGKFEAFSRRLEKILGVLTAIEVYSILQTCTIEGIDAISLKFQNIFISMKKKQYNVLDHRIPDFDRDYDDFEHYIIDLESSLRVFMDACLSRQKLTIQALIQLARFEQLKIEKLNVDDKYRQLFAKFETDIDKIKEIYMRQFDDPPILRNMTPIAGRIMWAQNLSRRLQDSMDVFKEHPFVFDGQVGRKVVHKYNRVMQVLLEYEIVYHTGWLRTVNVVDEALQVPPLVRHPDTKELLVNLDPVIFQVIQEALFMTKMKLRIPHEAQLLLLSKQRLCEHHSQLINILHDLKEVQEKVDRMPPALFTTSLKRIEGLMRHGLLSLTWNSAKLETYFDDVKTAISEFSNYLDRFSDLRESRIEMPLDRISSGLLFDNDGSEAVDLDTFIDNLAEFTRERSFQIASKSYQIEESLSEMLAMILKRAQAMLEECVRVTNTRPGDDEHEIAKELHRRITKDQIQLRDRLKDMFSTFSSRMLDALTRSTKASIETLRKRVFYQPVPSAVPLDFSNVRPLLRSKVNLVLPNIAISPSLEQIQAGIAKAGQMMMDVNRRVPQWDSERILSALTSSQRAEPEVFAISAAESVISAADLSGRSAADLTESVIETVANSYYKLVKENKDVNNGLLVLSTSVVSIRSYVSKALSEFSEFTFLWSNDKDKVTASFMDSEPIMSDFVIEIKKFNAIEERIEALPDLKQIAMLELDFIPLKETLTIECRAWRTLICKHMNTRYKELLLEVDTFMTEQIMELSRPINDLEDVRAAMKSLEAIRMKQIDIDMSLGPLEEAYGLLSKYGISVTKEESDLVDGMRYKFKTMLNDSKAVLNHLTKIQPQFKSQLLISIERLTSKVSDFERRYNTVGPMVEGTPAGEASERLNVFQLEFDEMWNKYLLNASGEQVFGLPPTVYPAMIQFGKELSLLQKLYGLYNAVIAAISGYFEISWSDLEFDKILAELTDFQNKCKRLPKALKDWPAYIDLKKRIDDFTECCPLLEMMSNKAMSKRHWERIATMTSHPFDFESPAFSLKTVMDAPLLQFKDDLEDICVSAVKEKDIEAKLKQVIFDWSAQNLTFAVFKNRGELMLKAGDTVELVSKLEDSMMVLSSLLSNRYNVPYRKSIQDWMYKLSTTTDILEKWVTVQNLWVYLEAVFVGGDIAKQLPAEAKRFQTIDKSWMRIMSKAHEDLNVVICCVGDEVVGQILPYLLEQLELCQKSLTGYLEAKRLIFPRFFFVSDPALLEILGQASDCHTIQPHLLSIAENINEAEFNPKEYDRVDAVLSKENERIQLESTVRCAGNVEIWLGELLKSQMASLHGLIRMCATFIHDAEFNLLQFINETIAQVGLLALQFVWTRDSEEAITLSSGDKKIMQATNQQFLDILNMLISQTMRNLTKVETIKFETLITIHVHQRDIFDDLVKMKIKTIGDFEWLKQARFYFREEPDHCIVAITDVDFIYQNEFLGCTDRLVITPLTDRCYITLAQALGMSLGGAPAGPAGTGKTETTKDMGKALGKYVVVFNCSDQMDFRGLGRIFKGLAQSGSWGCFDEFNRIELPVLSVAAQQIYIVLMAKKEHKQYFLFSDGDTVFLNPEFGMFLTMNPGYAGRQELPENLKVQFRTVAMMVPDRQIIMRVKLASNGFLENINLSQKFYVLYKLCEEQLSKQVHYDFGLRNILSVLRTLGTQKRVRINDPEPTLVMRVLRDMNLSKLVDEDEPLFLSLISDLFPGINLDVATYVDLQKAISAQVAEAKLINHPSWNLKVIQLYETQLVRHGMMLLGPSGTGKTKIIHTLMRSMSDCGAPHREMRMNPKAITAPQMFGRLDVATNDWTDGIFSALWRRTLKTKKGEFVLLLLDGPVDAIWIENLNSVLDDTKKLTLANGDRIPMAPNCKIVFEVHNIDNASPATVSRNGMVFISSSALEWRPILQGWLLHRSQQESDVLLSLFDKIYGDLLNFSSTQLTKKMILLPCNSIVQACDLLQGLLPGGQVSPLHLQRLVVFSLMWSIGALLELEDRAKMEEFMKKHESRLNYPKLKPEETIFEYLVTETGDWMHWSHMVPEYHYPCDSIPEYSSILIPNVDNTRTTFLMDTIAKQQKGVLLIGEQGTAKTVMIKGYMSKYNPEEHISKSVNFSSATTPSLFQRIIESYVEKRVGTTYGPPGGKKMTVFIDDINMPVINAWGDQITNEITRQTIEAKGFYNLEKPGEFTNIADIQFVAAMIHPGGGRNDIPERLKSKFSIFNCTLPSNASIDKIFTVIGCGYFCPDRFNATVCDFVKNLIPATRVLWQQTKIKMLPTPAKFHYIFNLRDLSRIWEGMLKIEDEICKDEMCLMELWRHESIRVIADRFITHADKSWFTECLDKVLRQQVGDELVSAMPEESFFVDFLRDAAEPTGDEGDDYTPVQPKVYERLPNYDTLQNRLTTFMNLYNEQVRGGRMDLVFFKDCMCHVMKILRVIRTPRGNTLLVGVGGSGKQSLTRLASFVSSYKIFQITLTRSYNATNLMEDLKVIYRTAGQEGKGVTFIFTDNEIKDEGFLESINNLLSSGEVANLFAKDEIDEITQSLVGPMKKDQPRRPPTAENLYDYFLSRAKNNLHVVLCFSPVGEKFRNRSLKFPGLISGCTMDWFSKWPKDALVAVSSHFLRNFEIVCTSDVKDQLIELMGSVHDGVADSCVMYFQRFRRQTHVTPKSYLSFLEGYRVVYTEKLKLVAELAGRMTTGLEKLNEASESVDVLSKELVVKERDLVVANVKADKVLAEVTQSAQAASIIKVGVQKVKDKAQAIVDSIAVEKTYAEAKLLAAKPALEEAEAALQTIKAADISTVRKLAKPPHLIMRIMDGVLILFQKRLDPVVLDPERPCPKPSWGESLKAMSASSFLTNLLNFPKDTINGETAELLLPYLSMEDFNLETAKKVCGNVAGLCSWVIAMFNFYGINKEVLPLKANLAISEVRLMAASKELNEAQAMLDEKEAELGVVQAIYDGAMLEKQTLLDDAELCKKKMSAASQLINGLGGEKIRWTKQSHEFKVQIDRLIGDVLILTGFLSYTGPFNQEFRTRMLDTWSKELRSRHVPMTLGLPLIASLVDNATIGEWNLQGLPNDELSIQNGIITTMASRYPLLIDPQGQGRSWIIKREQARELQVTTLNHKYFRTHIEDSLGLGRPLLIENVEQELDPCLDNVLSKNLVKSGTMFKVKVGDKECDFMKGFYLYITTKLPNPSYTPEVSALCSIIDFTVTMKGLEDQLLGRVIQFEKQELEAERTELMEGVMSNKRKMQELESNLLHKLTTTQGSLLDDDSVIDVLNITKTTAAEVTEKLTIAADTEIKINIAREEFRPIATRGSILYFLICEMSLVNCMYQISLRQFLQLFDKSLSKSKKDPFTARRLLIVIEYLTFEVFRYTCRGLYENHKFLLMLFLTLKKDLQTGTVRHNEFQVLIKGGAALNLNAVTPKPFKWITDVTWLNLVELSKLGHFSEIQTQIQNNERQWRTWFDKDAPEEENIPDNYSNSLDTFRKLLLIRSWCPDRTTAQARKYIADSMGARYADPVILDMHALWDESTTVTPMVCLLSMGSDPTAMIEDLAKKNNIECRCISMGQGQEVHARQLMNIFMASGGWALLQNCHLGLAFMDEVIDILPNTENIHPHFRLWMTTEPHPQFPIGLLQMSIKFTNEPPPGIKAGLKRTYQNITQEFIEICYLPQWRPMLYAISFLHTVVQERRKFGPLGWNIPYEFNSSDWGACVQFFQNHLDDIDPKKGISWNTVRYMIGEVQYGGRVTDDYDKRLLNTFSKVWFSESMFSDSFNFYKGYTISKAKKIEDVRQHILNMPNLDNPQAFGLHPNADITYQSSVARDVLDTILSIQPKDSGGAGETRESVVYRLAEDFLSKMPKNYLDYEVRERLRKMGNLQPLNIFLRQELDRMRKVLRIVKSTLTDLKLAIDGTIIMNEDLRDALDSMYDAKVPALWRKVSWPSSSIGFWFTELLERNEQFAKWIYEEKPKVFWLTGFFNAQGFLTAMRQEVTRAHKGWSLDSVMLHNDVTKFNREDINNSPSEGVYVYGLSLEGASWDRRTNRLGESHNKVLFSNLPVVHMYAIQTGPRDPKFYQCPVYKKPGRTDLNFITFILLKTQQNPDHWTLRGVAALCDIK